MFMKAINLVHSLPHNGLVQQQYRLNLVISNRLQKNNI
jgi:hypothetical protein